MTASPLQLSALQVETGLIVLDGATLTGIIVDDGYVFSTAHDFANDVTGHEVDPDSGDSRITTTTTVTLTESAVSWLVTQSGTTTADLSDVDNRGGIVWCRPGASDALRPIVGFSADPGGDDGAYIPSFDDGFYEYTIKSLAGRMAALEVLLTHISGNATTITWRKDTAANWADLNPILAEGEAGVDTTVDQFKLGDGVTAWTDLAFYAGSGGGGGGSGQVGTDRLTPASGDTVALSTSVARVIRLPDTTSATITFTAPAPTATPPFWVELVRGTQAFDTYTFHWPGDVYDPFGLLAEDSGAASIAVLVIPSTDGVDPYLQIRLLPLDGGVLTADTVSGIIASLIAAGEYATTTDIDDAITALGLGTAATKNVAASGNAASGEVVKGNDTRLSDSRAPSGSAGGDLTGTYPNPTIGASKVTSSMIVDGTIVDADINASAAIAQSKVASLTTDLAAKAPLASPTFTGTPAAPTASAGTNTTQLATTAYVDTAAGLLIPKSLGTTKGDLAAFDGTAWQRLAASASDGRALMTDSTLTLGVGYKRPAAVISATVVDTTVVSSTAETTLASHTITGGTLVAGDLVRLLIFSDMLNNTGSNVTYRWKVKFGSTTVLDTGAASQGTASTRRNPYIVIEMIAQSGTAQSIRGHYDVGTTTSWGPVTSSNIGSGYGVAAEDTSTDKALSFTCQLGTSSASADFIVHASCLELVKKR